MQIIAIYAGAAALLAALAALAVYHAAVVAPALAALRRLVGVHDELIAGGAGGAADRLGSLEREQASLRESARRIDERVEDLLALAKTDVSRIGFVRYDAFDDTESGLSYALALLNREGDGVVLTSIYSRNDTRTFGKAVSGYKPAANASEEELRAIERARSAAGAP